MQSHELEISKLNDENYVLRHILTILGMAAENIDKNYFGDLRIIALNNFLVITKEIAKIPTLTSHGPQQVPNPPK